MPTTSGLAAAIFSASACVSPSSCDAGTILFTRPAASASGAEMGSPVSSISMAFFWPTARLKATIGVEQNSPILTPGVAKRASSAATTRSQVATSWQPAAVAIPCTWAMTGWGMACTVSISSVHLENVAVEGGIAPDHFAQVVSGAESRALSAQDDHGDLPILADRREAVDQLLHVLERERVAALGPVHGDGGDRLPRLEDHVAERRKCASCHGLASISSWRACYARLCSPAGQNSRSCVSSRRGLRVWKPCASAHSAAGPSQR